MRRTATTPMGNRRPEGNEKRLPRFCSRAWKNAADDRCDKVRLHPVGRVDACEGTETRLGMAGWIRPCSRNMPAGTTACCAGLSTKPPYQLAVMRSSHNQFTRKPILLRHLPKPSLRNNGDGRGGVAAVHESPAGVTASREGLDLLAIEAGQFVPRRPSVIP